MGLQFSDLAEGFRTELPMAFGSGNKQKMYNLFVAQALLFLLI